MKLTLIFLATLLLALVAMMQAAEAQQRKLLSNPGRPQPASLTTNKIVQYGLCLRRGERERRLRRTQHPVPIKKVADLKGVPVLDVTMGDMPEGPANDIRQLARTALGVAPKQVA